MTSCACAMTSRGEVLQFEAFDEGDIIALRFITINSASSQARRDDLIISLRSGALPEQRRATGIDLALARNIVELMEGDLRIEPHQNLGLIIEALIPLSRTDS